MKQILTALVIATAIYLIFLLVLFLMGKRMQARLVAGLIPDSLILFKRLFATNSVKRRYKFLIVLLIAYLVLPIDFIPDFIPVVGQLDDIILIVIVMRFVLRGVDAAIIQELWPGSSRTLNWLMKFAGRPQKPVQ